MSKGHNNLRILHKTTFDEFPQSSIEEGILLPEEVNLKGKGLTLAQKRVLSSMDNVPIYVFEGEEGVYTFGNDKDKTHSRVYITATIRSLIKKKLCTIELCKVEGSLENCVGVVKRIVE